jgi:hypothetical protein
VAVETLTKEEVKDLLDEIIDERAASNPDFPRMVEEALARRKEGIEIGGLRFSRKNGSWVVRGPKAATIDPYEVLITEVQRLRDRSNALAIHLRYWVVRQNSSPRADTFVECMHCRTRTETEHVENAKHTAECLLNASS